ncbi:MAG: phosphoribosylaminoimidazolesuccinocarboxamide synthase [Gammaproteobacteria bacterium]|nr:phosphoribosylaminoimidazolesuccinocarboxamide synthase [Gammaproteobacteria bacterium]
MPTSSITLFQSDIRSLPLLHRGKVRDIYEVDDKHILIVTTDRLSAFDVVLPTPIPGKGEVLNTLSLFWFQMLNYMMPNHLTEIVPEDVVKGDDERGQVAGRSVVTRKIKPLPIEAVVRGFLAGSAWKEYQDRGTVGGRPMMPGMVESAWIPEALFTPTTKANDGAHDEPISIEKMEEMIGADLTREVEAMSLTLYLEAMKYASTRGIIIADTKFEFGLDEQGELTLIDEVLTPDSSRFWSVESYKPGSHPPSFDKQYVRDYLESIGWNKQPPAPELPPEVVARTAEKYRQALHTLMDDSGSER